MPTLSDSRLHENCKLYKRNSILIVFKTDDEACVFFYRLLIRDMRENGNKSNESQAQLEFSQY